MRDVKIGNIVAFSDVDYGIDLEPPTGYPDPLRGATALQRAWTRAKNIDSTITPERCECGLVVDLDNTNERGYIWFKVLVRGNYYWFDGQHLVSISD